MTSGTVAVGYFLFAFFFSLATFVLWTRIALRYFRISMIHPMSLSINKITHPIIKPFAPMFENKMRLSRYDWPCFFVLVLIELLKFIVLGVLLVGAKLPWSFVPVYTLADLIIQPCNLLFYAVIIRVVMSWFNLHWRNPIADILMIITEPLLRWGRHIMPVISGIDCSPMLILLILKIIPLFINASLPLDLL